MRDEIKRIHEYVWARHIDGSDNYDHSITEDDALQALDSYYSEIGNRNSPDQVYLGILLFERAYEQPEEQEPLFDRARKIFEFYRRVTGETDWLAVEDRLEDINAYFAEHGETPAAVEPPPPPPPVDVAPPPQPVAEVTEAEPAPVEPKVETPVAEPPPVSVTSAAEEEARREAEEEARRREATEAFIADLEVVEGMQLVPAGTFLFGPENREIYLDTFYVDRFPVTNAHYQRFLQATGYRPPRFMEDALRNRPQQPVTGVSLQDARQYAKWAGKDLPTERQWEKAARGTDGREYPWGGDPPGASDACFGLDPVAGAPQDVGQTLRNVSPFGVQDLCGNIWEWTKSPFDKDAEFYVVRGGSYNDPIDFLALHYRQEAHPKDKSEVIGFRCVKNVHH